MYIHYFLDSSLKVIKSSGDLSGFKYPPKMPLGYNIKSVEPAIAHEIEALIESNDVFSCVFSNETPIYNLGFFELEIQGQRAFFKVWQLTSPHEIGITYLLEYSTHPDVFTLDEIDSNVIENIEISRFRDIIKLSSLGVLQVDEQWRTLYASKTWSDLTGYSLTEVAGREWTQIIHHDDKNNFLQLLHKHAQMEKNSEQDVRINIAQGGCKWFNIHYRINYDQTNDCTSIILIFLDVDYKKKNLEHLKAIATTDVLTKLGNRYAFQEQLETYIRQLHTSQAFYLIFIDLDGFKSVNDAYGHLVGDKLLTETARRISALMGNMGFVARLGGDEFAIIRPHSKFSNIKLFVDNLLEDIAKPYSLIERAEESYISASLGIVKVDPRDIDYIDTLSSEKVTNKCSQLLRDADAAMYHAKESGKNTYSFFAGSINEQAIERQLMNDGLHRAFDQKEFTLFYQPQWDVKTNTLYGYEALIRWQQNDTHVGPDVFIPLLESNGLMSPVGKWVFEQALSDHASLIRQLKKDNLDIPQLSVNFSPIQFRDQHLYQYIGEKLKRYNIAPETITIEVTESLLISDHLQVKKQLASLKEMGLKIALDDFGTGYSSLSNLHKFPIDLIKVDRSFTVNLESYETQQIVRAIIQMSNVLKKTILFEGIETEQQLDFLKREGVDIIQGWLIAKAVPFSKLIDYISHKETVCQ
ncbi:EAL domain-containing protein [Leucothrix sargassi]|nr:EAL domain-containing protein [Leucothrix sargassi]